MATVSAVTTTEPARRLAARWRAVDPRVSDGVVAGVLLALQLAAVAGKAPESGQRGGDWLAYLLSFGLCLPYLVHRRRPLLAVSVMCASLVLYSLRQYAAYPGLSLFVLLFAVALHSTRRQALVALLTTAAAFVFALAVQPAGVATAATWSSTLLAVLVAWLAGENMRNRRARIAALEERSARLEREREERAAQAVAEERLRIARELHDVVAHSMSVIAVQSGVGNHVIDTQPEQARAALAAIETTSRAALAEMRRLLGVLRTEDDAVGGLTPAPGLADLPDLVDQVSTAGVQTTLTVIGEPGAIGPGVDLSAYRIVQEALTNVIKHGGASAEVQVVYGPDGLHLQVSDRQAAGAAPPVAAPADGSGHGIIGMRERVAVYGGEFDARPLPGGGFRVTARLPYAEGAR